MEKWNSTSTLFDESETNFFSVEDLSEKMNKIIEELDINETFAQSQLKFNSRLAISPSIKENSNPQEIEMKESNTNNNEQQDLEDSQPIFKFFNPISTPNLKPLFGMFWNKMINIRLFASKLEKKSWLRKDLNRKLNEFIDNSHPNHLHALEWNDFSSQFQNKLLADHLKFNNEHFRKEFDLCIKESMLKKQFGNSPFLENCLVTHVAKCKFPAGIAHLKNSKFLRIDDGGTKLILFDLTKTKSMESNATKIEYIFKDEQIIQLSSNEMDNLIEVQENIPSKQNPDIVYLINSGKFVNATKKPNKLQQQPITQGSGILQVSLSKQTVERITSSDEFNNPRGGAILEKYPNLLFITNTNQHTILVFDLQRPHLKPQIVVGGRKNETNNNNEHLSYSDCICNSHLEPNVLYISDGLQHVRKIEILNLKISDSTSTTNILDSFQFKITTIASGLRVPRGLICSAKTGKLYVTEYHGNNVSELSKDGEKWNFKLIGNGNSKIKSGNSIQCSFAHPVSICFGDEEDHLLVSSEGNGSSYGGIQYISF